MSGKRGTCPAGHPGVYVVGQFVNCGVKDCPGKPLGKCPQCGSRNVREFSAPMCPPGSLACWPCGKVWFEP